ncbi:MAG: class I SAM-dependent methyltransferase [Gammaproteobacteria bacterium]|nr:class I SAM-dependent methyltransferase [Gammaproteobacteria bacterium]
MSYQTETRCRACGSDTLRKVIGFGNTPLADRLVHADNLDKPDYSVPLTVAFCEHCSLVQIRETVPPEILFHDDYPYFSSVSPSLLKHFQDSAAAIAARRGLGRESKVIEAASNDGYMLRKFIELGIPVLGVDPAPGPVRAAREAGVPTRHDFFTREMAGKLVAEGEAPADVFLANNVLAHVPDLNGFIQGIRTVLKPDGVAVIEAPWVVDLIDHVEFDTIYHQHLCYFSVTALDRVFRSNGLYLNDVEHTTVHGGSLRLFVEPVEAPGEGVKRMLAEERERGATTFGYYRAFADRVTVLRAELRELLEGLKRYGKRIAGYGAAAKACTLLSFTGIDREILDFVADRNEVKHGWYMGGNLLPVVPPQKILEEMPDYVLILAWNFADEIMRDLDEYRLGGGRFVIPLPEPRIVTDRAQRTAV